jgi:parallel beta-helix repeat protein
VEEGGYDGPIVSKWVTVSRRERTRWRAGIIAVASLSAVFLIPRPDGAAGGRAANPQTFTKSKAVAAPCRGVTIRPGQNIQHAINTHPEGTKFCIRGGIYRLTATLEPKDRQKFIGVHRPVISGAKVLSSFVQEGPYWVASGQAQEHPTNPQGVCAPNGYTGCMYAEGVFFDHRNLRQVTSLADVVPGTFFFDYPQDRIYLAEDPHDHVVEASVVSHAFSGYSARGVVIRGLLVEKFATPAQWYALGGPVAKNWRIERNEVRLSHGIGICAGDGTVVRGNKVHDQGQMGVCGWGRNVIFEDNVVFRNNTEGFDWRWEAGGSKWIGTTGLIVRNNRFRGNLGPGFWTDTNNVGTRYIGNRVMHNAGPGIIHESSYAAVVRNNIVFGNGKQAGGWDRAGILIASSSHVKVFDNVVKHNPWGIFAKQHGESPLVSHLYVHDNLIVMCDGSTGVELDIGIPENGIYTSRGNRFERNHYRVGTDRTTWWRWLQSGRTWGEWRSYGHDTKGTARPAKC